MRIAIVGPAFPYKGGGARHTTELAHRLAADGHDVVIESWRAQYPGFLYPGQQTISEPEGEPFPGARRRLDWRRPDGWWRTGRALRSRDLVVLVVLSTVQVPAYLGILAGVRRGTRVVALCHNVLPHERKPYDEPLMRRLLRKVDGVLVLFCKNPGYVLPVAGRETRKGDDLIESEAQRNLALRPEGPVQQRD